LSEIQGSLEDAIEAIEASVQAGHKRAELVSRSAAARSLYEMNDYDSAEKHIERALELVDHLGANRFKPNCNNILARIQLARDGFRAETVDLMRNTLEVSRSTGIGFLGPWVLSTLALVIDDEESSLAALNEGESILKSGCVGHNYFEFYRNAMEVAWRYKDWSLIDRYAYALEAFIKPESIPWAEHYIKWGLALSAHGRKPTKETVQSLRYIKDEAKRSNLLSGVNILDQALANY
jgi:tetratricopeptide (TPR) repeat protein